MGFIRNIRNSWVLGVTLYLVCTVSVHAKRHALIVSVRAGDQQQSDVNKAYCLQTQKLLATAGFDRIGLFFEEGAAALPGSEEATDTAILARLEEESNSMGTGDEFWLFLYGYASNSSRGVTLATKGKRLRGTQLADALDSIEASQCVLALNQGSAALMKLLSTRSDRMVLTATSSNGQLNPPLLPEQLFTVWETNLTADCRTVFNTATEQTQSAYQDQKIAVAEIPQFFDGKEIDVFPFDKANASSYPWSLVKNSTPKNIEREIVSTDTRSPAKKSVPSKLGTLDFSEFDRLRVAAEQKNMQTANKETLQLIEEAKQQAPEHKGFPAFITRLYQRLAVNLDESSIVEKKSKIYLLDDIAAETYGRIVLEDYPPHQVLEIKTARIIYPDGAFLELKASTVNNRDRHERYHTLKVPGARAGCLIELAIIETKAADSTLPIINEELSLQKSIPIASAQIVLEFPKMRDVRYKVYGTTATPEESNGEYSKKRVFEMGMIPALESLPYDPPKNDFAIRLVASSLDSWTTFRAWTDRIMQDSNKVDASCKERAESLTQFAKTDTEKVKAIYEFLCDLRYETTPIGARALRPRLPGEVCSTLYGDCKDKANALVAMARSVGVTGFMALVNRTSSTDETFPSWQFNHAVAYFPNLSGFPDGLWCDATDGSTPFTSLPPGDIGRSALVLAKNETVFKTIQLPSAMVNSREEQWVLTVDPSGSVSGTFQIEMHGLSDYYVRQTLKRSSPRQLQYVVQRMIDQRATGLSIGPVEISALSNLSIPLHITASCSGTDWALTRSSLNAPYDLWKAVSVLDRDRELMLNDGQPFTVAQRIQIRGDRSAPSPLRWKKRSDIATMDVAFASNEDGWERNSRLELIQPRIAPSAYSLFQSHVSEWNARLKHHLTDNGQGTK